MLSVAMLIVVELFLMVVYIGDLSLSIITEEKYLLVNLLADFATYVYMTTEPEIKVKNKIDSRCWLSDGSYYGSDKIL